MLSVTVLLLVAVPVVLSTSQVPRCTPGVIDKVQAQWKKTGVPQGVMCSTKSFKVIAGSGSKLAQQGACKSFKFTPGHLYDETENISLPCTEQNGILTLPDSLSYLINFDKGILCTVRCSQDGPAPTADNPSIVSVAVTSEATKDDTDDKLALLKNRGFKLDYYQCT